MYNTQSLFFRYLLLLLIVMSVKPVVAQKPWSGAYGNEWLIGKYGQEWLKIGVSVAGIQRVSLPASFQNKANQLHLYYRGSEVALISATGSQIEFYGIPNDGASDVFLYRPYTGIRQNPNYSFYSDESSYFLTASSVETKIAETQRSLTGAGSPEPYHLQKEIKIYTESDTYSGSDNLAIHTLDNSFLIEGKGRSSKAYFKRLGEKPIGDPVFSFPFQLKNLYMDVNQKPLIELLLNGRTFSNNSIKASIGKTTSSLSAFPDLIEFSEFIPYKKQYSINTSTDVDNLGQGVFQLESMKITDQSGTTGIYSVNNVRITYPQTFNMAGLNSSTFNLLPTSNLISNVVIPNAPSNAKVYDITDPINPRVILGTFTGTTLSLMVERRTDKELNLLVSSEVKTLAQDKISAVLFSNLNPSENDYLIVTNETLYDAADKYANYRKSVAGGSFKTLVVKIKDIYNQFNYGEPSPVALRRFADYMIHNSPRDKHNLLLIGPSTTYSAKMVLNRELKEDVPTIGFPGSDILLVEGLTANSTDVPSIPVGRINATLPEQVENYLSKVIYYEGNKESLTWKKRVLHLNGGKSAGEISQFKTFLSSLAPLVEEGEVGGKVKAVVKQSTLPVEKANISSDVNDGVGMISYMGHGDPTVTDFDMGYISDAANSYQNFGKYPLLYFNGCGVGDIFNGRNNPSPSSSDRFPQSSDWVNTKDKGGIAVIANSYYSFQASSSRYLQELYNSLFGSSGSSLLTIGQIQRKVASSIKSQASTEYDIANIHQSLLQGDPTLRLIRVDQPDYEINNSEGILLLSESDDKSIGQSKSLRTALIIGNEGKYIKTELLPVRLDYFFTDGTSTFQNQSVPSVAFQDTVYVTSAYTKPISKIVATIDPQNTLKEGRKDNNYSELIVDWSKAKDVKIYPAERIKDIIPPSVSVTFNNVKIRNDENVNPNPKISISLFDDRILAIDTTLLDIFIKECGDDNCDFKRISFKTNEIKLILGENGNLIIDYQPDNLIKGTFELLVSGKDQSGNATALPFKLRFNILEVKAEPSLVVSPNPASDYIHFELRNVSQSLKSIKSIIYDASGKVLVSKDVKPESRDWYWLNDDQTSGLCIYKIAILNISGEEYLFSGKVALLK